MTSQEISKLVPQFVAEYESGTTLRAISRKFGVSVDAIQRRLGDLKICSWRRHAMQLEDRTSKQCGSCEKIKDLSRFAAQRGRWDGLDSTCKDCRSAASKIARAEDPEKFRERRSKSYRKEYGFKWRLKQYGITMDQYSQLLVVQKGKCAICGSYNPKGKHKTWHIDHDHRTGEVRGLLCFSCNAMLGHSGDDSSVLLSGLKYLSNPPSRSVLLHLTPSEIVTSIEKTSEMEILQ